MPRIHTSYLSVYYFIVLILFSVPKKAEPEDASVNSQIWLDFNAKVPP